MWLSVCSVCHFVKGFINKAIDVTVMFMLHMDIIMFHYRRFSSGKYEEVNTPVTRLNESPDVTHRQIWSLLSPWPWM